MSNPRDNCLKFVYSIPAAGPDFTGRVEKLDFVMASNVWGMGGGDVGDRHLGTSDTQTL